MRLSMAACLGLFLAALPLAAADARLELQVQPQGSVVIKAPTPALANALAGSLGCTLSDIQPRSYRFTATCNGLFRRNGQILEGYLDFSGLRQFPIDRLQVDVGVPLRALPPGHLSTQLENHLPRRHHPPHPRRRAR